MELIGEVELHGRKRAGAEVPKQIDENDGVDRTMLYQTADIRKEGGALGPGIVVCVAEDGSRFPVAEDAEGGGQAEDDQEDLARLEAFRHGAGGEVGGSGGDEQKEVGQGAEAAGHESFLPDESRQSLGGGSDEAIGDRGEEHTRQESRVSNRRERHPRQDAEHEGDEDAEVAEIPQAERTPEVAHQTEGETEKDGNCREQAEKRDLGKGQLKDVLQHVGRGDVEDKGGVD